MLRAVSPCFSSSLPLISSFLFLYFLLSFCISLPLSFLSFSFFHVFLPSFSSLTFNNCIIDKYACVPSAHISYLIDAISFLFFHQIGICLLHTEAMPFDVSWGTLARQTFKSLLKPIIILLFVFILFHKRVLKHTRGDHEQMLAWRPKEEK